MYNTLVGRAGPTVDHMTLYAAMPCTHRLDNIHVYVCTTHTAAWQCRIIL